MEVEVEKAPEPEENKEEVEEEEVKESAQPSGEPAVKKQRCLPQIEPELAKELDAYGDCGGRIVARRSTATPSARHAPKKTMPPATESKEGEEEKEDDSDGEEDEGKALLHQVEKKTEGTNTIYSENYVFKKYKRTQCVPQTSPEASSSSESPEAPPEGESSHQAVPEAQKRAETVPSTPAHGSQPRQKETEKRSLSVDQGADRAPSPSAVALQAQERSESVPKSASTASSSHLVQQNVPEATRITKPQQAVPESKERKEEQQKSVKKSQQTSDEPTTSASERGNERKKFSPFAERALERFPTAHREITRFSNYEDKEYSTFEKYVTALRDFMRSERAKENGCSPRNNGTPAVPNAREQPERPQNVNQQVPHAARQGNRSGQPSTSVVSQAPQGRSQGPVSPPVDSQEENVSPPTASAVQPPVPRPRDPLQVITADQADAILRESQMSPPSQQDPQQPGTSRQRQHWTSDMPQEKRLRMDPSRSNTVSLGRASSLSPQPQQPQQQQQNQPQSPLHHDMAPPRRPESLLMPQPQEGMPQIPQQQQIQPQPPLHQDMVPPRRPESLLLAQSQQGMPQQPQQSLPPGHPYRMQQPQQIPQPHQMPPPQPIPPMQPPPMSLEMRQRSLMMQPQPQPYLMPNQQQNLPHPSQMAQYPWMDMPQQMPQLQWLPPDQQMIVASGQPRDEPEDDLELEEEYVPNEDEPYEKAYPRNYEGFLKDPSKYSVICRGCNVRISCGLFGEGLVRCEACGTSTPVRLPRKGHRWVKFNDCERIAELPHGKRPQHCQFCGPTSNAPYTGITEADRCVRVPRKRRHREDDQQQQSSSSSLANYGPQQPPMHNGPRYVSVPPGMAPPHPLISSQQYSSVPPGMAPPQQMSSQQLRLQGPCYQPCLQAPSMPGPSHGYASSSQMNPMLAGPSNQQQQLEYEMMMRREYEQRRAHQQMMEQRAQQMAQQRPQDDDNNNSNNGQEDDVQDNE